MPYNEIDKLKDKDKPGFDSQAFKHAIGMIESSGGKFLDSKSSSAAGKYHFLWNLIKDNESLDGMSKTEFMADDNMQEKLMDQALSGKLEGYPNYVKYATDLKQRYGSELKTSQIAALTHFLGAGNVKKYLSNPAEFKVQGVNLSPEKYMEKYNQYATKYRDENPMLPLADKSVDNESFNPKDALVDKTIQTIDNTAVSSMDRLAPQMPIQIGNDINDQARPPTQEGSFHIEDQGHPDGLTFNNELREGGQAHVSQASDLVTKFEGGGTHEENPLGGIPQGVGANGKLNLVEEGETKWNGYIFSNAYDMEGNFTGKDGKKSNVFEKGGNLSCGGPGQPPCDEDYYETIRNSRGGDVRTNEDGSVSTHLMADNNKDKAFPTLFKNKDGSWDDYTEDHDKAFERATKDKEIYSFNNKKELFKFAREGSWKGNKFEEGGELSSDCGGPGQPPCEREKLTAKEEKSVMDYIDNQDKESDMKMMRDRANSQSMRASDPEPTFVDKIFNTLASPMSAMTRGNSAGNLNVNMDNRNPFDDVLDTINPFAWGQYASASKDSFDKGEYLDAGFNALGAIPIVPAWAAKGKKAIPSIKKGITKSGNKGVINSNQLRPDTSDITNIGSNISKDIIPKSPRTGNQLFDLLYTMTGGGKKEVEKLRPLISELAKGSTTAREVFDLTLANLKSPQGQKRLLNESLDRIKLSKNSGDKSLEKMTSMAKKEVKQKMKKFESAQNVNETLSGAIKGNNINTKKALDGIYGQAGGDTSLIDNAAAMPKRNTWWIGTNNTKSKPTAAHELQHMLQDGSKTNLDKEFQKLPQLKSKDVGNQHYFNQGSRGMEARAFGAELRQAMLDRGILKNANGTWGEITEDMLKESVTSFKNKPAGKMYSGARFGSSTRILDIVDPKGFKDLAKLMNKLTGAVVPVAIGASQLSGDNELRLGGLANMYKEGGNIDSTNSPSPKNKATKKSKTKTKENFDNYKIS